VTASDVLGRLAGTTAGSLVLGLVRDDGRPWGSTAAPFQLADAVAVLDTDSATPLHFITRPRGGSKTSDLAAVAIGVLVAQAPARSRSYAVAADGEQAGQLLDALGGYVARTSELAGALVVETSRVTNPATGASLAVLPADAASAFGLRPYLVVADEIAQWAATRNSRRVWEAVVSSLPKVPGSRLVCLTSAGDPAHWAFKVLLGARTSPRWRVHEVPGPVPWIDPAALAEQRNLLTESQYARLHLNVWSSAEDRLVSDADLRACVTLDGPQPPMPANRYVVGLDVGLKSDRTVIAVCHREVEAPRRVALDRMLTFTGTRLAPVRLADIEAAMVEVQATYRPAQVIADPWQAVGLMQRLRAHGLNVEEFNFTATSVGKLASVLFRALRDHELALPDDPELIEELGSVRLRENAVGSLRIDHDAGQHDDRAIALGLAVMALTDQAGGVAGVSVPEGTIRTGFVPPTTLSDQLAAIAASGPYIDPRSYWPGKTDAGRISRTVG